MVHDRRFDQLLSDRQRLDFSRRTPDSSTHFLRFLNAMQSLKLLDAVIELVARNPMGQEVLNLGQSFFTSATHTHTHTLARPPLSFFFIFESLPFQIVEE